MKRGKQNWTKDSGVRWVDLQPWIDQIWEELHAKVDISVVLIPEAWHLHSGVTVTLFRSGVGKERQDIWINWTAFDRNQVGAAESAALKLIAQALLEIQRELEAAKRAPLFS